MISKFKIILRDHKWIFIMALLVGIISVSPQIVFWFSDSYSGLEIVGTDAEHFYLSRVQEAYEGNNLIGNAYLEDKDKPFLYPILGENLFAGFAKISFLEVSRANIVLKFLLPFLLSFLAYFFLLRVFQSKRIAILSILLMFFGYTLVDGISPVLDLLNSRVSSPSFLPYTRPIHPSISSFFLFGSLYLLFLFTKESGEERKVDIKKIFWLGFLTGISLYSYIYVWTFIFVFIGIYFLWSFFKRDFVLAKNLFYSALINVAVTIPYWINFLKAKGSVDYAETALRVGLINTHAFVFSVWLALLLVILWFFWPKKYDDSRKFLLLGVISLWIVTNQHVITGVRLHFSHYHFYMTKPLIAIIFSALFVYLIDKFLNKKWLNKSIFILAALTLFYNSFLIQTHSYNRFYDQFTDNQRYTPLIEYLNESKPDPINIWTDSKLSEILAVYTNDNTPNHAHIGYFLNDTNFLRDRLLFNYRLQGIGPLEINEALEENKDYVSRRVHIMYFRENYGSYDNITDEALNDIEERSEALYKKSSKELFKDFEIDLVILDKREQDISYESFDFLEEVRSIGDFTVFEVREI